MDMIDIIYAKNDPAETIQEHTKKCLQMYGALRKIYRNLLTEQEWEILFYGLWGHDLGKISVSFQNKIRAKLDLPLLQEEGYIPHNCLSPAFINRKFFDGKWGKNSAAYQMLLCCIYYHHSRLEADPVKLKQYIKGPLRENPFAFPYQKVCFCSRPRADFIEKIQPEGFDETQRLRYILIKGLLHRADCCASAGFAQPEQDTRTSDGRTLAEKTIAYMAEKGYYPRPVQAYLYENRGRNVLAVSGTGSGKTEGGFLWADGHKTFYTLPLKSSISAIYKRSKEEIGFEPTALLHGDARSYYLMEENDLEKYEQAKLFSFPLTICTVDQILKFILKINGTEITAAALAGARLIVDEIQAYSPDLVGNILYALWAVSQLGGKFAILTATFPKCLKRIIKELDIPMEDCGYSFYGDVSGRHKIKLLEGTEFPYAQIAEQAKARKVLVLCNTILHTQQVFDKLSELNENVYLLHANFLRKDRRRLEEEIQTFAPNSEMRPAGSGIWISTQIVEASLNIDFDLLYTEAASVDSLIQRMGRVFRDRAYRPEGDGNVFILLNANIGDPKNPMIDPEIYDYTVKALRQYDGMLLEENDVCDRKTELMDLVYDAKKNPKIIDSNYVRQIRSRVKFLQELPMYHLENEEISVKFREIDSLTVMPCSVYQALLDHPDFEAWQRILENKNSTLKDRIQARTRILDYTISLSNYHRLKHIRAPGVLFSECGIHLVDCWYDFDEKTGKGKGLIKKNLEYNGFTHE